MKIQPYFSIKPWAGAHLQKFYRSEIKDIGEAWLLSTLPEGESTVDGVPLSNIINHQLTYLVKVIDAKENLSVQVHPNDEWAAELENSRGKTECWLILESSQDAGIYVGVKSGVSEKDMRSAIEKNTGVEDLLQFFPVKRGDFISVPAGTIHAIGGGVTLMEVQQASGITYRLWDWGRTGRELHLEKGMKVSNFSANFKLKRDVMNTMKKGLLLSHADFQCSLNESQGEGWFIDLATYEVRRGTETTSKEFIFVK
jgi:mannose-6-phosphate isomerase